MLRIAVVQQTRELFLRRLERGTYGWQNVGKRLVMRYSTTRGEVGGEVGKENIKEESSTANKQVAEQPVDDIVLPWEEKDFTLDHVDSLEPTERLPWETDTQTDGSNSDAGEPGHMILAPFKRKYSPLERVQFGRHEKKASSATVSSSSSNKPENFFNAVDFERDVKSLMVFKQDISSKQLYEKIDEFRPKESAISVRRYNQLVGDMKTAFKVSQLRHYVKEKQVPMNQSVKKTQLIKGIIKDYWKINVSEKVIDEIALNTEAHIALQNRRELFLLLSHRGYITSSWSRLGAKLSLSPENSELIVSGSPNIVSFVQVSWNELLNNVQSITLKLRKLRNFYETELHRQLPIDTLQELSNVYFDKVSENDQLYVLSSFKQANLAFAKEALLAATEYSGTVTRCLDKTFIERDGKKVVYKEYKDPSLSWYAVNDGPIYRLKLPKQRQRQSLLVDPVRASSLFEEVRKLKQEVDESEEKFQYNFVENKSELEGNDVGIEEIEGEEVSDNLQTEPSMPTGLNFSAISSALLHPTVERKPDWMPNVINATLGRVLFQGKSSDSNVFFHSNFPEVNKKLAQLELLDKDTHLFGSAGGIKNQFSNALQIKLVPDAFKKFTNFKDLPNIEIWFDVRRNKVDLNSCNVFVNEFESNYQVPLPEFGTDVKFQSSYNSMIINSEVDDNLSINKKQKPFSKFLSRIPEELLDLSEPGSVERLVTTIQSHTMAIKMDDRYRKDSIGNTKKINKNVPYLITSVSRRRSIELEFHGMPVIYEVVSNADGERYEVSILSDIDEVDSEEVKEKQLKRFTEKVFEFVRFLED
ncbi:DEKNAAC103389 [Brettanomyces naardenensis]|uniref:DEKNAAC103389 n=1 Tax=Brettanomyces naardenensis TaxID=13370 RepID=A0A448YNE4_BRENA|nr:DEKNAAC103389 [Brettanomyces naardenensis]